MSVDESAGTAPNGTAPKGASVILYDGVCGLCNRFVRFVLRHDREGHFYFAALQSEFAAALLKAHDVEPSGLNTIVLVRSHATPQESLLFRSDVSLAVLAGLGGAWALTGRVLGWVPRPLRDVGYGMVARARYRIFGRYDTCPVPDARVRSRFLG